ncbi:hypothetical protein KCU95_g3150, partial [Aureobasidium melanogenum]
MTHFRINALERCFEAELARQTRINQLQDSKWTEFEYGARQSLEWVGNFRAAQCEVNVEHENNTERLRARCARLENFVDSEITKLKEKCARLEYWVNSGADDRVTQQALERRRKVVSPKERHDGAKGRAVSATVAWPEVWTYKYKLYVERENGLVSLGPSPLVDVWTQQCNSWSGIDRNWQQYKPLQTCLNSMLMMGYGDLLESPEEAGSFACFDCERRQTFCVVFDNERGLLNLLPRRNAPQPGDQHVTDLATFINSMQRPMN